MDDKFNPGAIILNIVVHGIVLGCVLAIAWPVRCFLDRGARKAWNAAADALREEKTVKVNKELAK